MRNEIALNLNPAPEKTYEGEDNKIVYLMDYIINNKGGKTLSYYITKGSTDNQYKKANMEDIFIIMIQWLLKHDWERSKYESKSWIGKLKCDRKKLMRQCINVNYKCD